MIVVTVKRKGEIIDQGPCRPIVVVKSRGDGWGTYWVNTQDEVPYAEQILNHSINCDGAPAETFTREEFYAQFYSKHEGYEVSFEEVEGDQP